MLPSQTSAGPPPPHREWPGVCALSRPSCAAVLLGISPVSMLMIPLPQPVGNDSDPLYGPPLPSLLRYFQFQATEFMRSFCARVTSNEGNGVTYPIPLSGVSVEPTTSLDYLTGHQHLAQLHLYNRLLEVGGSGNIGRPQGRWLCLFESRQNSRAGI